LLRGNVKPCQIGFRDIILQVTSPPPGNPNPLEKQDQLARILATQQFKRHFKLSELLRFLVDSDLAGAEIDQEVVGVKVYGRSKDWIPLDDSCVRDGMSRLRKLLDAYYGSDGIEDRLNLELDGYKTIFTYNIRHPAVGTLRRALRYIGTDPRAAFRLLDAVLALEPNHAEARAARAETELWRVFYGYDMPRNHLDIVERQAQQSLQSDEGCWRAHVVTGALLSCRRKWGEAAEAFDRARKGSLAQTCAHPWYAAFLMATGKPEEALQFMKAEATRPSDSPLPQLAYAIFLYAARQNDEARRVLLEATKEEENARLFNVMQYLTLFAKEGFPSKRDRVYLGALTEIRQGGTDLPYPVSNLVCHVHQHDPGYVQYDLVKSAIEEVARKKLAAWQRPPDTKNVRHSGEPFLSPFQLAIGYMAIGDTSKAIELLGVDLERGHPLMVWLHLWPIFDSLRKFPEFKSLIAHMDLCKP
jgi:hypothetical protein